MPQPSGNRINGATIGGSVTPAYGATRHALSCHRGITMVTEGRIVVA